MNYRKFLLTIIIIIISFGLMLSACSKKKKEQEITITLKTEGVTPAKHGTAPPAAKTTSQKKQKSITAKKKRLKKINRTYNKRIPAVSHVKNKAIAGKTQIATNIPATISAPSPEDIAKRAIIAIIGRQKQAMATKDINLALEDLAGNHKQNEQTLKGYFDRYEKINVNFSNISINIIGSSATATMDQKTAIVTKSIIPQTITELTKVQWKFVNKNGRWLITGTHILARLKRK